MKHTQRKYKVIQKMMQKEPGRKLQLGCGRMPLEGFVNVDWVKLPGVDLVVDLEYKLPFQDNEFDLVYARHTLEHIQNLSGLIKELYRITNPNGKIRLELPHCSSVSAFADPTHKHFFTLHSFDYYKSEYDFDFYSDVRFEIVSRRVEFTGGRFKILNFLSGMVNLAHFTQDLWERFCWHLPMENLYFTLRPIKRS